jgi:hypothetical protein
VKIHWGKLSPPQGWQKLWWELGIVTVGVLIALGIGELAKSWHDEREAREARAAIRAEIGSNLGVLSKRIETEACIERRLNEIGAFLNAASRGSVAQPPTWIGRPQQWNMDSYRWEAASQAGRVSLFPVAEQSSFSDLYGALREVGEAQDTEQQMWAQMRSLEGQSHISEATVEAMRSTLSRARYTDWLVRLLFRQAMEEASRQGIPIAPHPEYRPSMSACVPIGTAREEALRLIGSDYGAP